MTKFFSADGLRLLIPALSLVGLLAAVAANPEACRFASAQTRQTKLQLGRIWMDRQMPLIHTLCVRIESGNDALMQIADELI